MPVGWLAEARKQVVTHRKADTMTEPLGVSIIVASYNNEPFLAAAIDSALSQVHSLCEVIVVDDCSTDNSRCWPVECGWLPRTRSRAGCCWAC